MIHHKRFLTSAVLLSALGATLGAAGLASAQPPGGRGPVPFGAIDLNDDGVISAQEFTDHRGQRQAARAAQGRPMRNAGHAPRFEDWDKDGDGLLTPQELTEGQQARFAARHPGWGPDWGPGMGSGWGPGRGFGWGPGPVGDRPCWRNP